MVATKIRPLEKQKAAEIVNHFLVQYQNCCNQKRPPHTNDFDKFLAHHFHNSCNARLIGKNIHDFLDRIKKVQQKYARIEISEVKDCLISDNKAIFQFEIELTTHNGEKVDLVVMAIATIEDHHILDWSQIAHERHIDHFES